MKPHITTDAKARWAAKKLGLVARKSRWRRDSVDNYGGFMIVDPVMNAVVAGERYNLDAKTAVEFCREDA